jgi:hypothetical protein
MMRRGVVMLAWVYLTLWMLLNLEMLLGYVSWNWRLSWFLNNETGVTLLSKKSKAAIEIKKTKATIEIKKSKATIANGENCAWVVLLLLAETLAIGLISLAKKMYQFLMAAASRPPHFASLFRSGHQAAFRISSTARSWSVHFLLSQKGRAQ